MLMFLKYFFALPKIVFVNLVQTKMLQIEVEMNVRSFSAV